MNARIQDLLIFIKLLQSNNDTNQYKSEKHPLCLY